MVGIIALLAGNLIAKGQLAELLSFIVFFLAVGVLQWPLAAKSAAGLLVCYFLSSLHDGISLEWAVPRGDLEPFGLMLLGWGQVLTTFLHTQIYIYIPMFVHVVP